MRNSEYSRSVENILLRRTRAKGLNQTGRRTGVELWRADNVEVNGLPVFVAASRRRHSLYSARENAWPRCHAENPGYRR